jgi:zinc D-Ala-D-Ala dipeptidase
MRIIGQLAFLLVLLAPASAAERMPAGFAYLRDVDASIVQEMRYAGFDNFTGHPLPGYEAAECVLRGDVAAALKKVQADLARENLSLKVYDCYRPTRAVRAFARWANDGAPAGASKRFFPNLQKRKLFALGYIAAHSGHSTGTAVDLTIVRLPARPVPPFDRAARYGPCTAPAAQREPDNSIDMGTGFDCFDRKSHTRSAAISAAQKRRRGLLVAAMRAHGLHNFASEWWHFSLGPQPAQAYDFPILPRPSATSP